jgi:ppGpp synthetase/RelA/SpoT-type nucleotidyltranferase
MEAEHPHVSLYRDKQVQYSRYAEGVARILETLSSDARVHKIEHRSKDPASFAKKCGKALEDGTPKYADPIHDITDLSGVRVIVFVPSAVSYVCKFIEDNFKVIEQRDVGEERFASGHFGYQSIHLLVAMTGNRLALPDFKKYKDMICEIQVRTVLQHAWAEMEHDIQYKGQSDIPALLERKFLALAGMLEIADREFQSIQDEDARLKLSVKTSLESDLTKQVISDATQYGGSSSTEPGISIENSQIDSRSVPAKARDFVSRGRFDQAISLYTDMLREQPRMHTLYIGRARARFLAGDQRGALDDLALADQISADDPVVAALREQIREGRVRSPTSATEASAQKVYDANLALARGDSESAFVLYSDAEQLGHNMAFCIINKSMACALANDHVGAKKLVESLRIVPGSPMAVNIKAMSAIVSILRGDDESNSIGELETSVANMPEFNFNQSPLRHLEAGLQKLNGPHLGRLMGVFQRMRREFIAS